MLNFCGYEKKEKERTVTLKTTLQFLPQWSNNHTPPFLFFFFFFLTFIGSK